MFLNHAWKDYQSKNRSSRFTLQRGREYDSSDMKRSGFEDLHQGNKSGGFISCPEILNCMQPLEHFCISCRCFEHHWLTQRWTNLPECIPLHKTSQNIHLRCHRLHLCWSLSLQSCQKEHCKKKGESLQWWQHCCGPGRNQRAACPCSLLSSMWWFLLLEMKDYLIVLNIWE